MATFAEKLAMIITANASQATAEVKRFGATVESEFTKARASGQGFAQSLAAMGGAVPVAATAIAAVGAISVKSAADAEAAQSRLATAIVNVGASQDQYAGKIDKVVGKMAKYGFNNVEVTSSLARLIPATKDVQKAIDLQATAADLARARGISLADATTFLGQAEQKRFRGLLQSFVLSQNQVKGFKDQEDAIKALQKTYGGAAGRYQATFAGQLSTLSAESKNLATNIGSFVLPTLSLVAHGFNAAIGPVTDLTSSIDKSSSGLKKLVGGAIGVVVGGPGFIFNQWKKETSDASVSTEALKKQLDAVKDAQKEYAAATTTAGTSTETVTAAHNKLVAAQQAVATTQAQVDAAMLQGSLQAAESADQVFSAEQTLAAARAQLNNDLGSGSTEKFAQDRRDLTKATIDASRVELQLAAAEREAGIAAFTATGATLSLAEANQILGQSAGAAAAESFGALSSAAFANFDAASKATGAFYDFGDALDALHPKEEAAAASGKTAAAAYYDQQSKLQTLRDAMQAVADDAVALTQAQTDQADSLRAVLEAQYEYEDLLKGIDSTSKTAVDAQREANKTKDDARLAQFDYNDAVREAAEAVRKYGKHSEQAERAEIRVRQAKRDLTEALEKQNEAQRVLNGVLHGYAENAPEVVAASKKMKDAQKDLTDKTKDVREATDAAHDSIVALGRATADVQGKLDSVSTASAKKELKSFQQRLDEVKLKAAAFAESVGAQIARAAQSTVAGVAAEIVVIKDIIASQPALAAAFDDVLNNLVKELARLKTPGVPGSGIYGPPNPAVQAALGLAGGGPAYAGHAYVVGEKRPELFVPRQSGTIIPRVPTASGGGRSYNIVINTGVGDRRAIGREVVECIKDYERTSGPGWRN